MLYLSLVCSVLMLAVTCGSVWWSRPDRWSSQIAWLFLVFPMMCGLPMPAYLLNSALVAVGGLVYVAVSGRERFFYGWALFATLVSYAIVGSFVYKDIGAGQRRFPLESLVQRLSYEQRRAEAAQRGGWAADEPLDTAATGRLKVIEDTLEFEDVAWQYRSQQLKALHQAQVDEFVNSSGFGVSRMRSAYGAARPPQEFVIPLDTLDVLATPLEVSAEGTRSLTQANSARTEELFDKLVKDSWDLHRKSIVNFTNPIGFGYIKDRTQVAGFQGHQFSKMPEWSTGNAAPHWKLKRVELVSLLTHDEPGVYVTDNLPRMDLLRDVPVRPLDDFERMNLPQLGQGEDVIALQTPNRLRVLGAIRAAKQCLSCHEAQRGELLGAFSYHFDPAH